MITNEDILRLAQVFPTKEDLKEYVSKSELFDFKDELFDKIDRVFGELKIIREEQLNHQQIHDDIQRDLDDLKSIPVIAQELKKKKR